MSQDQIALHIFDGIIRDALSFSDQAKERATRRCSICPSPPFQEFSLESKLYGKNSKDVVLSKQL